MTPLVVTDRLRKTFGQITAVDGISLKVARGEVLGFLGPNGAGKSTTMKMVTGFLTPDSGTASVAGIDVGQRPKEAKRHFGYLPEGAPSYSDMTTREFLAFIAEVRGKKADEGRRLVDRAVERTQLGSVLNQRIETLSKGFRRRVGLAQAILHEPEVLILDEPTDGLDPNQKHQVRNLIQAMAKDKAIIVSTHILEEVEAVCTRAVVIDRGHVVADGTAADLQRRAAYHNGITLTVTKSDADKVRAALAAVAGVGSVEALAADGAHARLRAIPKAGATIAPDVAAMLREKGLAVEEMVIERGRLDDVFRQITSSETAGGRADQGARHG